MLDINPILPVSGRGTATRSGVVEGVLLSRCVQRGYPSTMLRMVPLPRRGRNPGASPWN
jgi:hypothetical protein